MRTEAAVLRARFDYLARDSLHLSIKLGCDFSRILNFSKARMSTLSLSLIGFRSSALTLYCGLHAHHGSVNRWDPYAVGGHRGLRAGKNRGRDAVPLITWALENTA